MSNTHAIRRSQKFDTKIMIELRFTNQDNIAVMPAIDPLGDDRSNVIYIVIMAKKKKGFHIGFYG